MCLEFFTLLTCLGFRNPLHASGKYCRDYIFRAIIVNYLPSTYDLFVSSCFHDRKSYSPHTDLKGVHYNFSREIIN